MKMLIKNREALITNGDSARDRAAREIVLDGLEAGLSASDPVNLLKSKLRLVGDCLEVAGRIVNLKAFKRIFVVGAGKASDRMAFEVERVLGERVAEGLVVVTRDSGRRLTTKRIKLMEGGHPFPDASGESAAEAVFQLVKHAQDSDLILCLISGGGSALLPLPAEDVTLEDKVEISRALMRAGGNIHELNIVRKHLSRLKGGWMAKAAYPATLISLILSDVVGGQIDVIASGPTSPDPSTFKDAITILKKYSLWEDCPENVKKRMLLGEKGSITETPKPEDPCFTKVYNTIIGSNRDACRAVCRELRKKGICTNYLTSYMEGEARYAGMFMASLTQEVKSLSPQIKGDAFIVGGETTVTVKGGGVGGRNMEVALGAVSKITSLSGVAIASLGTDGADGSTDAAGAMVDGRTLDHAQKHGLDIDSTLANNDSYNFFHPLGDLIITGSTGTNVNDICIALSI